MIGAPARRLERNRPSVRRVLALGGLWLAISGAALASPGCYGHNCESGLNTYGTNAGEGRMVDENTWESGPFDGTWLWFPRQQYYIFDIRALNGRTPEVAIPYLSDKAKGGSSSLGGGNTTVFQNAGPNRIDVKNDTCSDYYLRLVVIAPPLPPQVDAGHVAPEIDAGAQEIPDAGHADAGDAEAGP